MEAALLIYVACAIVVMIWTTLQDANAPDRSVLHSDRKLHHLIISDIFMRSWLIHRPDLILLDVSPNSERNVFSNAIPESLRVSSKELPYLLKWLPPRTTLVLFDNKASKHLNVQSEKALLDLGIDVVYWLDYYPMPSLMSPPELKHASGFGLGAM